MDTSEVIVEILTDIFGEEKKHNEITKQISFDCPVCSYDIKGLDEGDGKGNLEVNYDKSVFKCWSCAETHGTHGHIGKLIDKFGSREDKKLYNVVREDSPNRDYKKKVKPLKLPKEFKYFNEVSDFFPEKKRALKYLHSRSITEEIISKHRIGFCYEGEYSGRIIVPSFDDNDKLNYFVARSWNTKNRIKYKNPNYSKDKLIFNQHLINWDEDIYIVEGVFDSFFINNSIPLLGKFINDHLFETLYEKCKKNIILCLDSDAWNDSLKIYHKLNGGALFGRIKIIKLEDERDIAELKGDINLNEFFEIK
jgi:DNA primase